MFKRFLSSHILPGLQAACVWRLRAHWRRRVQVGAGAVLMLASAAVSAQALPAEVTYANIVAARKMADSRQWDKLQAMVPVTRSSLLAGYPQYWLLRQDIRRPDTPLPMRAIAAFLDNHRGTYLDERLRRDAILAAAGRGDFASVRKLAEGLGSTTSQVDCAILHARHVGAGKVNGREAQNVFQPGTACWDLYDTLVADNVVQFDVLSRQLRDAIDVDDLRTARRLATYMFGAARDQEFAALLDKPKPWLQRHQSGVANQRDREMALVALARLARHDMLDGHAYFRSVWTRHLPAGDAAWVQAHFALLAALRQNSVAPQWYVGTDEAELGEYNAEWRVRAALRTTPVDWDRVLHTISLLPDDWRSRPAWLYWQGRALAAQGKQRDAMAVWGKVADRHRYYGQLAAEELGELTRIPQPAAPLTQQEMAQARAHPGLRRALALFDLGWRSEAVGEWNFALRGMNDRQLLAAAELAREAHIYDRVINTSELTREQHDFRQRFLAPFQGQVTAKAREIGLDPAWVYGLIRQESRFVMAARSGVGASGLMQLMPATARWVARRIGMSDFHASQVNDFDVNTTLGTNYLNIVLQDLNGSQLLASAGYNAGPRRPHNWRSTYSGPVEGAIFAETIPFRETRDYVQKVLSNATYYTALFTGEPQSLKDRLGTVVPQANEETSIP